MAGPPPASILGSGAELDGARRRGDDEHDRDASGVRRAHLRRVDEERGGGAGDHRGCHDDVDGRDHQREADHDDQGHDHDRTATATTRREHGSTSTAPTTVATTIPTTPPTITVTVSTSVIDTIAPTTTDHDGPPSQEISL